MVGRGNADHVNLLAHLVEHHAVIGEGPDFGRILPFALQPLLYCRMSFFVRVHNGNEVVLASGDYPVDVTAHATAPAADLDDLELVAGTRGGEEVGDGKKTTGGHSTGGES